MIAIDMRYVGQNFELAIPMPQGQGLPPAPGSRARFSRAHQRKYGHHDPASRDRDRQRTAERAQGAARARRRCRASAPSAAAVPAAGTRRPVWFTAGRPADTAFIDRARARRRERHCEGPLVVTQFDATTLVPPGSRLSVGERGSLLIEVDP